MLVNGTKLDGYTGMCRYIVYNIIATLPVE